MKLLGLTRGDLDFERKLIIPRFEDYCRRLRSRDLLPRARRQTQREPRLSRLRAPFYNAFILLGPDGHLRATLTADSTDARLVFLDNSKKIKGIFAADRLVFSDLSGNARVAIRPESDGGTLTIDGRDGGGVQLSRDSEEVGLYMTHGKGDSLSVSIKKDKNPDEVLLQNGPAIQLFDEQGYQTYLGQAGIPGKSTPHVSSLVRRKEGHDLVCALTSLL